jgi:quinolinate synthase
MTGTGGNEALIENIRALKARGGAVILAHTYQPAEIQDVADFVGDSYALSVEATKTPAETIVFCGVMFMAETAAILNPQKTVIIPEPRAGCPMADMIAPEDLIKLKQKHPGHAVICYVNSTAEIKALSDICCTSSNALAIVRKLPESKGIIFIPDKYLGSYIRRKTGRDMILWNGFCPTHAKIKPEMILSARRLHPKAVVMIHPEAPDESRQLADHVLSTGGMCDLAKSDPAAEFIVATEKGIIHTLETRNPAKRFHSLNEDISCPNMKMTTLHLLHRTLEGRAGKKVIVDPAVAQKASLALTRMLEMSK